MAVKTITIDLEAYELLARQKRGRQSFSQVIKAHFGPAPTAGRLLERIRTIRIEADALDAMERQIQARKESPARIVVLGSSRVVKPAAR
jgi:predicted CopG family antitoxin